MNELYHFQQLSLFPSRVCTTCGKEKPLDLFPQGKYWCKECTSAYMAQYRLKNHEKLKAYDRFRGVSPERKKEKLRAERTRVRSNPEFARKNAERLAQWHIKHPFVKREQSMRKYARLQGVLVETVHYERVLERDGLICHICNEAITPDDLQFDHVIPPSRGGAHTIDHIAAGHGGCNVTK